MTIVFLVVIAWQSPLGAPPAESFAFLYRFVNPMFAPALLLFVSAPSLLVSLANRPSADNDEDSTDANRLIARAVQFALTFVLSFATVMIAVEPTSLANVLFALLLGFITFVLAETLAPPKLSSAEMRYQLAMNDVARREVWAERTFGKVKLEEGPTSRVWLVTSLAILAPVFAMTAAGTLYAALAWGHVWAFSGDTMVMMAATSFGAIALTIAWLSMADRADSPSARAWRGGTFIFYGVLASVAFACVFFIAGAHTQGVGWLILFVTAVQAAVLWLPVPWGGRAALRRVAETLTARHLRTIRVTRDNARSAWEEEVALSTRS